MKKKILILLFLTFFISGCSVDYNITIKDKEVSVDSNLIELNKEKWDDVIIDNGTNNQQDDSIIYDNFSCLEGNCTAENTTLYDKLTFEDIIDIRTIKAEETFKINGLTKIKTKDKLGMNYKVKYNWNDTKLISKIFGSTTCYDKFSVLRYKDEETKDERLLLSTSKENECFNIYTNNLDEVKINVKTNHKVISHNADIVSGNTYQWIINKNNYTNKSIQIILSEKTVIDYKTLIIIATIVGSLVVAILIVVIVINEKNRKANEI